MKNSLKEFQNTFETFNNRLDQAEEFQSLKTSLYNYFSKTKTNKKEFLKNEQRL